MFAHERQKKISALVARKQRLTVRDLQDAFPVSPATLRRDLTELEAANQIVRIHGGVVHPSSLQGEPSLSRKSREAVGAKREMAEVAAALLPDVCSIFLDGGTTCLELARRLFPRTGIRLITHSVPILHEACIQGRSIMAIGGELRPISGALTGAFSLSWMSHLQADWAFVGASGLTLAGPETTELSEAAIKQAMLSKAGRKVLVADGSKWAKSCDVRFADWADFDFLVTDAKGKNAELTRQQKKLNILVA